MSSVPLRHATPLDAGALGAILSDWIDATPWMPRLHTRAEDIAHMGTLIGRGWVTVAGEPAKGFLAREAGFVHALYVDETARGCGIGTALLSDAMQNALRLELWTFEANSAAHRFYEGAGFRLAETTDGASNDEGLPDRRYVWTGPGSRNTTHE